MKKNILLLMATIASSAAMAQQMQYPKAAKDGTVDEYFGTKVADPYRWLENDTSAQTAAWVEAENQVTNAFLKKIPFREKLLKRLTQLSNYDTSGAPFKRNRATEYSGNLFGSGGGIDVSLNDTWEQSFTAEW